MRTNRLLAVLSLSLASHLGCEDGTVGSSSSTGDDGAGAGETTAGTGAGSGTGAGATTGGGGEGAGEPVIPAEHPRVYFNEAQVARLSTALEQGTPAAVRFRDFVDQRLQGGDPYEFRGWHAALLYVLTNDQAYADLAISYADEYVMEEEALIGAGERPNVAFDSYLEVGDRVGDVMLVYDWCHDRVTPEQGARWIAWANQAVYNVWHPEEATWGGASFPWSGWSIDDPVNNYYFSFLRATMLVGLATYAENPDAPGWVDQFRQTKIAEQLVPRYEAELMGGGSREGTGYGVAMGGLFKLYDIWEQSTGESIDDLTSHARLSVPYLTHAIVPTADRLAPIGDHARDSTASLFDYHRDYLLALGSLYPSDPAVLASRTLLASSSVPEMGQGFMRFSDFLYDPAGQPSAGLETLYPVYHAQGVGHVFGRSDWTPSATWMGLIAGSYSQSHAHHDQGSLLVYQGEWLAYDANVDSHSGIRQEEELHNLVRIEAGGQVVRMHEGAPPTVLHALADDAQVFYLSADAAPVYDGQGVDRVGREVVWIKPGVFVVRDVVATSDASARRVYQLNTPISPSVSGRRVTMDGQSSSLDLFVVAPSSGPISTVSWASTDDDVQAGYRIEVAQQGDATESFLTVLGVGGAVTSASGSSTSATVTLSDGRTATVSFSDGAGPHVEVTGAGGFVRDLPLTVQTLPLEAQ